ncbi:MAG: PAS domain S-box protein [Verrucomicrobia bacterium]|jgi:PAS domain S-box-containing protein|nr:PAS domain S-box protein [Verrucomicrobiota bacterium]OQC24167.1 MAG: Oxygen sensor histidine kinase NreB [Verrucomicrobia bacterium ADurb.Bin063]MBP8014306.1 PAS domain S-box protein [Verrucomicrobiota bacterium]HNS69200.1 PAS domain S-box protein [Verrucomicrobiota bacterium]HNW07131.1 PAS domain S-box protein [Verrucomicrobiota bacterium]
MPPAKPRRPDPAQTARKTAARRDANRGLRLLAEGRALILRATDETKLLRALCRRVVEIGGYPVAWVGRVERTPARTVRPVAWACRNGGIRTGTALRTGGPELPAAGARGGAAAARFPLKQGRRVLGVLTVQAAAPGGFRAGEKKWLAQLAGDLARGLAALRSRTAPPPAPRALRPGEQQIRLIMDNLADLVALLDVRGRRLYNSPSYRQILGDPDRLRGTNSFAEVHPDDRARVTQAFRETVRTGVGQRLEYRLLDQAGRVRHIESQGSVIQDRRGRVAKVLVVARDLTARKRTEEELHRLSARLLQVRDLERRHLARELHDTTAQHLAALTLNLGSLKGHLDPASAAARALCDDCIQLASQAAQEIRTHSYLLHPPLLEAMGLVGAIEDYTQGLSARSGITLELEAPADFGRLPEDTELALFRVLQESLSNVLKHSGSSRAQIRLARGDNRVTLEVRDMGHGIPEDKLARIQARSGGSGVGLGGMQERLRLLGGQLELESGPAGTLVRAAVPLPAPLPDPAAAP